MGGDLLPAGRSVSDLTLQRIDSSVEAYMDDAYTRATSILNERKSLLFRVVDALLEENTLSGPALRALLDEDKKRE